MNLPDTAILFLDAFRGVLSPANAGDRDLSGVYDREHMPMVHCHCFTRELEPERAAVDIRQVGVGLIRVWPRRAGECLLPWPSSASKRSLGTGWEKTRSSTGSGPWPRRRRCTASASGCHTLSRMRRENED